MLKQTQNISNTAVINARTSLLVLLGSLLIASVALLTPQARANSYEEKINALKQQNAQAEQSLTVLGAQAASYQDAINKLQGEVNALQNQITSNENRQASLQRQIIEKQAEVDRLKGILSSALKTMYIDDQMSTIEMLATSKNLSDYIDRESYRTTVRSKVQETMTEITVLQQQMQAQKTEVEKLLVDQKSQRAQLAAARNEQASMLSYTQGQQSAFNSQVKANTAQIAKLRQQQAAENARLSGGKPGVGVNCGGGYPGSAQGPYGKWGCNYAIDNTIDNWGMYNRQCVSYTAFKVSASGRHMPYWGGRGNAKLWDDNARSAGIPVDTNPRVGDVAVKNAGTYGHVMYVEAVYDDGSIYVSDYNQQWDGRYRAYVVSAANVRANNLQFIHF